MHINANCMSAILFMFWNSIFLCMYANCTSSKLRKVLTYKVALSRKKMLIRIPTKLNIFQKLVNLNCVAFRFGKFNDVGMA